MALVNGPMNSVLFPMSRDRLIRNDYYSEFGGLCGLEDELLLRLTEAKHALKNDPLGQISSQFSMFFYATHPEFKCGRNIFLRLWQLLRILLRQIAQEIDCSDENINQQQESVSMYIFLACEYLIKASTMVSSGYVGLKKTARRDSNDRDIIELQIQTMSTLNELLTSNAVKFVSSLTGD